MMQVHLSRCVGVGPELSGRRHLSCCSRLVGHLVATGGLRIDNTPQLWAVTIDVRENEA